MDNQIDQVIINQTKEYYGRVLNKSTDLKTNACCTAIKYPDYILDAFNRNESYINEAFNLNFINWSQFL